MRKIFLTLFLVLISAKVGFAAILFSDDFSANNLDKWNVTTGTWYAENGELHGIGGGGQIDAWIYAGDESWTDYDFEAKADLINKEAEYVFRSTGHWNNEYRLQIWALNSEYSNRFVLQKYQNGITYDLTNGPHFLSPVPITDTLLTRISVVDNNINIFFNGEKVFEYQDNDPLLNGKIGLGAIWSKHASFDDVLVSDSNPSAVPEPATMLLFGAGLTGMALRRRRA